MREQRARVLRGGEARDARIASRGVRAQPKAPHPLRGWLWPGGAQG